ncbi:hypothetical protein, partial [Streptococcus anginosus]|uniref:hypothetical protein n=1 Tax=Streptococcus anginosus TaxID=1328 RepID=UPI002ED98184
MVVTKELPAQMLFCSVYFLMYMGILSACMSVHQVHAYLAPSRSGDGVESPGTGVIDACKLHLG